jgi:MarR family transcriptional regulator, 2-MHQ and catechol-resistance regulon repressor
MGTRYEGSPSEVRALSAFINLVRASESLTSRTSRHLEEAGLTPGQFGALETLYHCGPLFQKDLCTKLLRSGGNMVLLIDNLEKRGWVKRRRSSDDRRHIRVRITPAGRKTLLRVLPAHVRGIMKELSVLKPKELSTLRTLCRRLGLQERA